MICPQAEGFSAHKMIHAKLQNPLGILPALSNLVADVRKAQQSHQTDVPCVVHCCSWLSFVLLSMFMRDFAVRTRSSFHLA